MRSNIGKNVCCGSVDASKFKYLGSYTFEVIVNTEHCGFTGQPKYFTSLEGQGYGQYSVTVANIENPKGTANRVDPQTFRVILRATQSASSVSWAVSKKWKLNWCGLGDSTHKPQHYAVCCGQSKMGAWKYSSWNAAKIEVDTSGCGWKDSEDANRKAAVPPMYFTSVSDTSCGKGIMSSGQCAAKARGINAPYHPKQTSFTLRAGGMPGEAAVTNTVANNNGWQVNWCAIKKLPPTTDGVKGYPCTAVRLLKPNGGTTSMTNQGGICCGETPSSGWSSAGDGKTIKKEIDISACKFSKVRHPVAFNWMQRCSGTDRSDYLYSIAVSTCSQLIRMPGSLCSDRYAGG